MVHAVLLPPTLLLLLSLQGCLYLPHVAPEPEAWLAPVATPEKQCPDIRGRYLNAGTLVVADSYRACSGVDPQKPKEYTKKAGWNCDTTLAGNLIKMRTTDLSELLKARRLVWVELTQPDADTLELHFPPFPPESSHEPIVLTRKGGDFDCSGSSLTFSTTGSFYSFEGRSDAGNIAVTAIGLLVATGGVVSTERSFRPLQDGSLSMEVTEVTAVTHLLTIASKIKAFVRWDRALVMPVKPGEPVEDAHANRVREEALRASLGKRPVRPVPDPRMITERAEKPRFEDEPGPEPASPTEAAQIRSIQEGLREVGYIWVPLDGRLGWWTRRAIRGFKSSDEYTGRDVDEKPSEQLKTDIDRAIPTWAPVLLRQAPHQLSDAEQK